MLVYLIQLQNKTYPDNLFIPTTYNNIKKIKTETTKNFKKCNL